jgi:3-phosphoshikimate 1-carboxyvinyltransferase
MMNNPSAYAVEAPEAPLSGKIQLPSSKSISNRILIIQALSKNSGQVSCLSDSDDTRVMLDIFKSENPVINVGHAGTAMRFLTAYLSTIPGERVLTGSSRMKQRPVKILVEALQKLGAGIEYIENKGYPPLRITGSGLQGGILEIDGSVSSQYISALLMIAPVLKEGLTLRLTNRITSRSYIEMTTRLMEQSGIEYTWNGNEIRIPEMHYKLVDYTVEADWTAAGYWYQILAMAGTGTLELRNLRLSGLQGDEAIASWFSDYGIVTNQTPDGVNLDMVEWKNPGRICLMFHENPDIAQTMAALCVAKRIPFHFSGLETLKIKETNRIAALQNELRKFGAWLTEPAEGELEWNGMIDHSSVMRIPVIDTYDDHRMAMAMAPLALTGRKVIIRDPRVVTKSYPGFWEDLKCAGFRITET